MSAPVTQRMKAYTEDLVSVDDVRATFRMQMSQSRDHVDNSPLDPGIDYTYETPGIHGFCYRSLSNSDRNVGARLGFKPEVAQNCSLGYCSIDALLFNLDLDTRVVETAESTTQLSFEWKPFFDAFLGVFCGGVDSR